MHSSQLAQKRAQLVQNQWPRQGSFFHSFHRRTYNTATTATTFPTFYHVLTPKRAQAVHNISAMLTDMGMWFSPEYTGPITTTTTFIYKRIEERAI